MRPTLVLCTVCALISSQKVTGIQPALQLTASGASGATLGFGSATYSRTDPASNAYRKLLSHPRQAGSDSAESNAGDSMAASFETPAAVHASTQADANVLALVKKGDKQASKRASIRYYWFIACGSLSDVLSPGSHAGIPERTAAEQIAATPQIPEYVKAGVADTRNKLIKAALALAQSKPATKEQCIKYQGTAVSAGFQAKLLVGGDIESVALWTKVVEILSDDLGKLMPLGISA